MQSDYLSQMANLIRENPGITVREIANALQFADNKSVYYWLEKNNFHGINDFKRVVLSDLQRFTDGLSVKINDSRSYLVRAPLFAWDPSKKDPVGEWCFLYNHPDPRGIFAVLVGDQSFSPWLMPQDILIVDEHGTGENDEWILLVGDRGYCLGISVPDGPIIDPRTGRGFEEKYRRKGRILRQERIL